MAEFKADYTENVRDFSHLVRAEESFDLIRRRLAVGVGEMTLFYIDGFVKDDTLQRLMQYFLDRGTVTETAEEYAARAVPYVEVDVVADPLAAANLLLSGAAVVFATSFGKEALVIDARTYPARQTQEPDNDRVMAGAHDGFVETLIFNTALIRRRIRDTRLTVRHVGVGRGGKSDVCLLYLDGVADSRTVRNLEERLSRLRPDALCMGIQSLEESLIKRRWYNPFPKVRRLERPDAAAAEIMEGKILVLCDTSPQAMVLPTSFLDFLEETDDYYFPPLTGTYLRLLRIVVFFVAPLIPSLWYLALTAGENLPPALAFLIPEDGGALPILLQLYLAEIAIDALKLASMNAPSLLSHSLSVIGGLILGDFAVAVGWFCPDVIFYTAVVSVAGFSQRSHELTYAMKFTRMALLGATALFGWVGFLSGVAVFPLLLVTNVTVFPRSYLRWHALLPRRPKKNA